LLFHIVTARKIFFLQTRMKFAMMLPVDATVYKVNVQAFWACTFFVFQEVMYETDKQTRDHGNAEAGDEFGPAADDFPAGAIPL
jgi:hypothetical protein